VLLGGAGDDTAVYSGDESEYRIEKGDGTMVVSDSVEGRDGTDELVGIERLVFRDGEN
jgi:hypothetical protein